MNNIVHHKPLVQSLSLALLTALSAMIVVPATAQEYGSQKPQTMREKRDARLPKQRGDKASEQTPDTPALYPNATARAGTSAQDPALVQWYEQATAYYNAVMAGDPETPKPTEMEWNNFMAQLQWAQTTLGYGAGMGGPQGPTSNQFGGMSGTMDNWVYTEATAKIGFTGNGTHDIWSNDVTIDVAPVSCKVTIEETNDTRATPAESVVKITVADPATGTQAVYFVHDFDPPKDKIQINTPEEGQITNNTSFADGVVEWGAFKVVNAKGVKRAKGSSSFTDVP